METLTIKSFQASVEARLQAASLEELREVLRAMAARCTPSQRVEFLAELAARSEAEAQKSLSGTDLLEAIVELMDEMRETLEHADDWHCENEDLYDEDESLGPFGEHTGDMALLFSAVQEAFDAGHLELARTGYDMLFECLDMEDDYGCGIRMEDLEGIDRAETCARCLRAVYECTPLEDRAQAVFDSMIQLQSRVSYYKPDLEALIQVSPKALPDQEPFLQDWVALLEEKDGAFAEGLFREAVRLAYGKEGIARLARQAGLQQGRFYLEWLKQLESEENTMEVFQVAQEALETLPRLNALRAELAAFWIRSARALNDQTTLKKAQWLAFEASPDLVKWLDVWAGLDAKERPEMLFRAEKSVMERMKAKPSNIQMLRALQGDPEDEPVISLEVLIHLQLMAGKWDDVQAQASQEPVLGWSHESKTQRLAIPTFLAALASHPQNHGHLMSLWRESLETSTGSWHRRDFEAAKQLEAIYLELFHKIQPPQEVRQKLLAWSLEIAHHRIMAIVGGTHRNSYAQAAHLAAACRECLESQGETAEARRFVATLKNEFPRHRAFQDEMKKAGN